MAADFAAVDPYRAATHNKGIMNGIDPIAIATGNDWRAIEAGAHAYAARGGRYSSLTDWWADEEGNLCGRIELPIKVGIVGAPLESNPTVALNLRLLGVESATELAQVMAAVGLAQNFAAIRALATEGIQKGHMTLHARSVVTAAGVPKEHFDEVLDRLIQSGVIKVWKAQEIIAEMQEEAAPHEVRPQAEAQPRSCHGRRLRQGHPAGRARGRLWAARDRGTDSADDQGARRGLRRGYPSVDSALGRGVPRSRAIRTNGGRSSARPASCSTSSA